MNPYCENALEIQIRRAGSAYSVLLALTSLFALALTMWAVLTVQSKLKSRRLELLNRDVFDAVLFNTEFDLSNDVRLVAHQEMQMRDEDIWSHTQRMYLPGDNSIKFPWYLSKDFSPRALDREQQRLLIDFFDEKQSVVEWKSFEKDLFFASSLICPPLASLVHKHCRKRHSDALKNQVYRTFDSKFWDMNSHDKKTLRIGVSNDDYKLAFIDFLDYTKVRSNFIGPSLPITLLLSGSGSLGCPYRVNFEDDALAKSIVYFNPQTLKLHLPLFFQNLNTLLARLSFAKFASQTKRDLSAVVDWIELANKTLFNPVDTKATLYVIENEYREKEDRSGFEQQRRSYPMEAVVFESFPEVFSALVSYISAKLAEGSCEVRFGLVFKPFDVEQR